MTEIRNKKGVSRRRLLQLAGIGAGTSVLFAGGSRIAYAQAAGDVEKAITWAKANLPNSTPEIINAAAKEGKLVLTLQLHGDDVATSAMVKKFKERYPFLDVSYTLQTSAQLLNKFSAEINAKKGISDYLHLPSNLKETNNYIASGAIAQFVISQDAAFPESAKQSGIWYAWFRQHGVTAYRTGALSEEEKKLIRTYKGLADPRFKGRLGITAVNNSISVTGSYVLLGEPDQSLWTGLAANKPQVKPAVTPLTDGLLAGEYDIAVMDGFAAAAGPAMQGAPLEFVISSPSPVLYAPGGISSLAPNPNAAKLWQDWAMSKEGQDLWSSVTGSISTRADVAKPWSLRQPWFFEDTSTHRAIDWVEFGKKQADVVARFKQDLQGG